MGKSYKSLNEMISDIGMENSKVIQYSQDLENESFMTNEEIDEMNNNAEMELDRRFGR